MTISFACWYVMYILRALMRTFTRIDPTGNFTALTRVLNSGECEYNNNTEKKFTSITFFVQNEFSMMGLLVVYSVKSRLHPYFNSRFFSRFLKDPYQTTRLMVSIHRIYIYDSRRWTSSSHIVWNNNNCL